MADNSIAESVVVAGVTFADDDIGGVKYPRNKIIIGADGVNDGDVSAANPFPVKLYFGTTAATTGAGAVGGGVQRLTLASDDPAVTALQIIDNIVSGSGVNVSQINGVAPTMGNGISGTGVQRVTIASDSTGQVALAAGTAAIGKLAANPGVTIGAVEIAAAQTLATVTTVSTVSSVSAVIPGTGATNLGKAVDSVAGATDTLVVAGVVRDDALTALTPIDGDYTQLRVDALGQLWVNLGGLTIYTTDAVYAAGTGIVSQTVRDDVLSTLTPADGDLAGPVRVNARGAQWTREESTQTDDAAFIPATSYVVPIAFQADETATDSVDEGDAGCPRMTLDRKVIFTEYPHTTGGLTMSKTVSAASTNATSVKGSAGKVYSIQATNVNAAVRYLKLYNKATAPVVGTDVPVKTLSLQGGATGPCLVLTFPTGLEFSLGIAFALTTEATDAGTTGVSSNEHVINIDYK